MNLSTAKALKRRNLQYIAITTAVGAFSLVFMSALQKGVLGAPMLKISGYIVPILFGGGTGFIYGYFSLARDRRIDSLERESEIRRVISAVNHTVVGAIDVDEIVPKIADIIGASSLFQCTYVYLLGSNGFDQVCIRNSALSQSQVQALHHEKYVDSVFKSNALHLDDVTTQPFAHHGTDSPSHAGVGISITHDGEQYGILTVHFPPSVEPTKDEIDLLETIGSDLGYFIHNKILEFERKSLAEIVERIDDPVMLQDIDGSFQVVNEAVSKFAGIEKDDLKGRNETAFMDADAARTIQEMKERVIETEESVSYTVTPSFPDGRERTFSTTRYPYYDNQDRLDGSIAICRDITDLEAHQQQMQVMDRVLRHNVNNNMNVVQGYAEMIRAKAGGELAKHASKIVSNSGKLLEIAHKQRKITDFLSKSQPKEVINISLILEQLTRRLHVEYPAANISVVCPDEIQVWAIISIEEAIEELLTNSIVHSSHDEPNPKVTVEESGDTVWIRVIDENQQIPEMDRDVLAGDEHLGSLRHGSGLGLWFVKLIVDHSDGTVDFTGADGRGNIVTIELASA